MPFPVAALLPILGIALTGASLYMSQQAQKDALKAQQKQSALEERRAKIKTIREARIKRALIASRAAGGGVLTATGPQGGMGGVQAQLGSELGYFEQTRRLGGQLAEAQEKGAQAQTIFSIGKGINTIFGYPSLFKGSKQ